MRHPHRVTLIRLARARETYELRWRENLRADDGTITRVRRTAPGGNSKATAYGRAEKVWRNLDRSGGYHGTPPAAALASTPTARTLKQVSQLWLAGANMSTAVISAPRPPSANRVASRTQS